MKVLYAPENPTNDEVLDFFRLKRQSSLEDVKKAYRRLQLIYHPDKHADASKIDRETATRNSQTINRLYIMLPDVLRDEIQKKRRERKFTKKQRRTKNWPKAPRRRPPTKKQYAHCKTKPSQTPPTRDNSTLERPSKPSHISKNHANYDDYEPMDHNETEKQIRAGVQCLVNSFVRKLRNRVSERKTQQTRFAEFISRQKNKRVNQLVTRFIRKLRDSIRQKRAREEELVKLAARRRSERAQRQAELKEYKRPEFRRRLYLKSALRNIFQLKDWMICNVEHREEICREWSTCFEFFEEQRYFLWCLASELITNSRRYKQCFRIHLLSSISFCDNAELSRRIKDISKKWMKWNLYDSEFFEYLTTFNPHH